MDGMTPDERFSLQSLRAQLRAIGEITLNDGSLQFGDVGKPVVSFVQARAQSFNWQGWMSRELVPAVSEHLWPAADPVSQDGSGVSLVTALLTSHVCTSSVAGRAAVAAVFARLAAAITQCRLAEQEIRA